MVTKCDSNLVSTVNILQTIAYMNSEINNLVDQYPVIVVGFSQMLIKQLSFGTSFITSAINDSWIDNLEETSVFIASDPHMIQCEEIKENHVWIFYHDLDALDVIGKINAWPQSKVYSIRQSNMNISIFEHYKLSKGHSLTSNLIEEWVGGKNKISSKYIWKRRANLQGIKLIAGHIEAPDLFKIPENGSVKDATGFLGNLNGLLMSQLNYTIKLVPSVDGTYGLGGENQEPTGLVGMLSRGEIDLTINLLQITQGRSLFIDYLPQLTMYNYFYVTRKHKYLQGHILQGLFSKDIVKALFGTLVLIFALSTVNFCSRKENDISGKLLIVIGLPQAQGSPIEFQTLSMRIIQAIALIFGFFSCQILSARLAADSAVGTVLPKLKNSDDIIKQNLNLYVLGQSAMVDVFGKAKHKTPNHRIHEYLENNKDKLVLSTIHDVRKAFLNDEQSVAMFSPDVMSPWKSDMVHLACDLEILPQRENIRNAFGISKKLKFDKIFTYYIKNLEQSGILDKLNKSLRRDPVGFIEQYCAFRNHELPSINIQDVRQMFAILGYGCSFGIHL